MLEVITTEEAAKRLYVTPYTVRKYIRRGLLKAIKLGKHYLIEPEEVTAMLKRLRGK